MPKPHYASLPVSPRSGLVILTCLHLPQNFHSIFGRSRRHIRHILRPAAPLTRFLNRFSVSPRSRPASFFSGVPASWSFHLHAPAARSAALAPFLRFFVVSASFRAPCAVVFPSPRAAPAFFFIEFSRLPPSFPALQGAFQVVFFGVPAITPTRLPFWRPPEPVFTSHALPPPLLLASFRAPLRVGGAERRSRCAVQ
ncbi:hypothetical protein C8J57DRAFT_131531, partial [Mycena rebaudengoi]